MLVRMKATYGGADYVYPKGSEQDLGKDEAQRFIDAGAAELVEPEVSTPKRRAKKRSADQDGGEHPELSL